MSKLFKLKKWLTLSDAAKHLTSVIDEDVAESDLLRFALDGELKLSVQLVNTAYGCLCVRVLDLKEVKWNKTPPVTGKFKDILTPKDGRIWEEDGRFFQVTRNVTELNGIWDLPMTGGERIDVEHEYQKLMGGPEVTTVPSQGVFLKSPAGCLYEIQNHSDTLVDSEPKPTAYLSNDFIAGVALPKDRIFVIQTTAMLDFIKFVNEECANTDEVNNRNLNNTQWTTGENEIPSTTFSAVIPEKASRWPWGNHHTESLGHLDSAARRYWVNYDPSDIGTAPIKTTVSEWLQRERKVSKTMADSIASMLRPDGLPTGPRK